MDKTLTLFNGKELRDIGIKQSVDNANFSHEKWSDNAFEFLIKYIQSNEEFMTENVRIASEGIIPEPPSKRAWGGVIVRAVKLGLINRKGFRNVKNAKAHCTPATLWKRRENNDN